MQFETAKVGGETSRDERRVSSANLLDDLLTPEPWEPQEALEPQEPLDALNSLDS